MGVVQFSLISSHALCRERSEGPREMPASSPGSTLLSQYHKGFVMLEKWGGGHFFCWQGNPECRGSEKRWLMGLNRSRAP